MGIFKKAHRKAILGMNARNLRVELENPVVAIRLVNNKYSTKAALEAANIPVSPTIAVIRGRRDLAGFDWEALPDAWALKPNNGRRGAGILLAAGRDGDGWRTASGAHLSRKSVVNHLRYVLDGDYSMEGVRRDWALFEPLIVPHPDLTDLVPSGLPDVRVICHHTEPILAMTRLPTAESDGRANLHQGAVGASVDLESGRIVRAQHKGERIHEHPDTGYPLIGAQIPAWEAVVAAAAACGEATGLGYLGADVVVDEVRGPLVLEVNARPGLEIQNVSGVGLAHLLESVSWSPVPAAQEHSIAPKTYAA